MYKYLCSILLLIVLTANAQFKWNSPFGNSAAGGLSSNTVYTMIIQFGTNPTNGVTSAQVVALTTNKVNDRAGSATNLFVYQINVNSNLNFGTPGSQDAVIAYDTSPDALILSNTFYTTAIVLTTNLNIPGIDVHGETYLNQNTFAYGNLYVQLKLLMDQGQTTGTGAHLGVVDNGDGNWKVVLTNDNNSGGGNLATNNNQFAADPLLAIKIAAMVTNLNNFGSVTNRGETYLIAIPTNLTAVSIVGKDSSGRLFDYPIPSAGSGNISTNPLQFGANPVLTLKAGILETNLGMYGPNTNYGSLYMLGSVDTNLTAVSVIARDSTGKLFEYPVPSTGSQTPWLTDINANRKNLTNVESILIPHDIAGGLALYSNSIASYAAGTFSISAASANGNLNLSGNGWVLLGSSTSQIITNDGNVRILRSLYTEAKGTNKGDFFALGNAFVGTNITATGSVTAASFTTPSTSTANGIVVLNNTNATGAFSITVQSNAVGVHELRFDLLNYAPGQVLVAHLTNKFGTTNIVTITNVAPPWQTTNNNTTLWALFSTNVVNEAATNIGRLLNTETNGASGVYVTNFQRFKFTSIIAPTTGTTNYWVDTASMEYQLNPTNNVNFTDITNQANIPAGFVQYITYELNTVGRTNRPIISFTNSFLLKGTNNYNMDSNTTVLVGFRLTATNRVASITQ